MNAENISTNPENIDSNFQDILRVEGVNCKGFGILPKFVMLDPDLTIESKTIYSYFCSFAGNGTTAFPKRDTILFNLRINKDTYYKHLKLLTEQGYLKITQERTEASTFTHNIFTLVSNPKKFKEATPTNEEEKEIYSKICFSGLKSTGYGMIPKAVMLDTRLDIKAKGLYAYLCSFTGAGDAAFPEKSNILYQLSISHNTYNKYLKQLVSLNYILVKQRNKGRFDVNDYYLLDNPDIDKVTPCTKISDTETPDTKISDTVENGLNADFLPDTKISDTDSDASFSTPCTKFSDTTFSDTVKPDTNINSPWNINSSYYKSIYQSDDRMDGECEEKRKEPSDQLAEGSLNDVESEYSEMFNLVKCLIDYEVLIDKGNCVEQVDEIANFITDILVSKASTFRVNREDKSAAIVKKQLTRLSAEHIEYVIEQIENQTGKIKNIRSYLLTALYNAPLTYESYVRQQVAYYENAKN